VFFNKKMNFKGWDFIDKVSRLVKRNMKDLGYEEEERDWESQKVRREMLSFDLLLTLKKKS